MLKEILENCVLQSNYNASTIHTDGKEFSHN